MSITFDNTLNAGYRFARSGDDSMSIAVPSAAADGSLLIGFVCDQDATLGVSNTASISNLTGEVVEESDNAGSALSASLLSYQYAETPLSTIDFAQSSSQFNSAASVAFVFTGHNALTPIRARAVGNGTGTTITFPDTSAVSAGDLVLRFAAIWSEDFVATFSDFAETEIYSDPNSAGTYGVYSFAGFKTMSSNTTPGTTTLTVSRSVQWIAFTVVIADAADLVVPSLTAGPILANLTQSGFDMLGTADENCTVSMLITAPGAAQPSDAAFDASAETTSATASTLFSVHHTG